MAPENEGWEVLDRTGFLLTFGPIHYRHIADGTAFAFRVDERHTDLTGTLSTGALMAFTDYYVGMAGLSVFDISQVTMQLQITVIGQARVADWVEGRARLVEAADRLAFLRGIATVGNRVISTAEGIWKQVPALPEAPTLPEAKNR